MIRINLLPFRAARKKENIRRQISIFLLSLALGFIVLFYYNNELSGKINKLSAKVEETNKQLKEYKNKAIEVDTIKTKLEVLKTKTEVIKTLEANRKEPVYFLDAMTRMVIEKRMWLTKFEEKGGTVNINGIALDNQTVADFMTRLEGSGLFSSVNLKTLSQKTVKKTMNLKSFTISCKKVPFNESTVLKAIKS